MTPPSPCLNICRMHPATGWCEGCGRTLDEIARWSQLDDRAKDAVWAQLPARQQQLFAALAAAPDGRHG